MSSTQNATSPRPPRPRHQHSKSATQVPPNINGKHHQRRQKGNRAVSSNHVSQPPAALDTAFADSAVLPSEEVQAPSGSRSTKKHTQSQPASDRVLSPTTLAHGSLTDSELAPNNPATTPAKAQGAYAGPTFHASPAPSALPIPKFLSKSVPPKSHARPPTPLEEGSDSSTSPTPSPSRAPIAVPSRHRILHWMFCLMLIALNAPEMLIVVHLPLYPVLRAISPPLKGSNTPSTIHSVQ